MEKNYKIGKHNNRPFEIQRDIIEHVKAIRSLEKELLSLGADDLCEDLDLDGSIQGQSLWRNLERIENYPLGYSRTDQQFCVEPCYSTLDLLVQKLLHTPKLGLQWQGCSMHSLGKCVQFCISGEVDESIFLNTHE